ASPRLARSLPLTAHSTSSRRLKSAVRCGEKKVKVRGKCGGKEIRGTAKDGLHNAPSDRNRGRTLPMTVQNRELVRSHRSAGDSSTSIKVVADWQKVWRLREAHERLWLRTTGQ